jgi:hypothetical protein
MSLSPQIEITQATDNIKSANSYICLNQNSLLFSGR